jgi:hypothetical protein
MRLRVKERKKEKKEKKNNIYFFFLNRVLGHFFSLKAKWVIIYKKIEMFFCLKQK